MGKQLDPAGQTQLELRLSLRDAAKRVRQRSSDQIGWVENRACEAILKRQQLQQGGKEQQCPHLSRRQLPNDDGYVLMTGDKTEGSPTEKLGSWVHFGRDWGDLGTPAKRSWELGTLPQQRLHRGYTFCTRTSSRGGSWIGV